MTKYADGPGWTRRELREGPQGVRSDIPLGRWKDAEVFAHWSVLVTVGLFAVVLATGVLPDADPGGSTTEYWAATFGACVVLVLTLAAHELAHATAARALGMPVKRVTLWMLGGVTELSVPVSSTRADAVVALAGPAASVGLGALVLALAAAIGTSSLVGAALVCVAAVSIGLAVLNLLPGAPLDGGRVLRAALCWRGRDRDRATVIAARAGRLIGCALVALGVFVAFIDLAVGGWLAVAGWFVVSGADAERATIGEEHLPGLKAADVMTPSPLIAPAWWSLQQCVAHLSPGQTVAGAVPVIGHDGHVCDVLTLADFEALVATRRGAERFGPTSAARRVPPVIVTPETDATEVAASLRQHGGVVVVEQAQGPVGIITPVELAMAPHLSLMGWRVLPGRY